MQGLLGQLQKNIKHNKGVSLAVLLSLQTGVLSFRVTGFVELRL